MYCCFVFVVISEENKDPVSGLRVVSNRKYAMIGQNVDFSITVDRGSHLSYSIQYGDGVPGNGNFPLILAFKSAVHVTHRYKLLLISDLQV